VKSKKAASKLEKAENHRRELNNAAAEEKKRLKDCHLFPCPLLDCNRVFTFAAAAETHAQQGTHSAVPKPDKCKRAASCAVELLSKWQPPSGTEIKAFMQPQLLSQQLPPASAAALPVPPASSPTSPVPPASSAASVPEWMLPGWGVKRTAIRKPPMHEGTVVLLL
jgi:hypothetical protein